MLLVITDGFESGAQLRDDGAALEGGPGGPGEQHAQVGVVEGLGLAVQVVRGASGAADGVADLRQEDLGQAGEDLGSFLKN